MTNTFLRALCRRKTTEDVEKSELSRCLTLFDLTALGVGGTLGLGVYVLAGSVAKSDAGPAVCLSFLVAAIASAVAGLCYGEFAARVPRAGSAYVYSYVSVGEFVAFTIGWNLILEYIIGTASVARGLSSYLDQLTNNTIQHAMREALPIDINFLSTYPDFLSFLFVILLTVLLSIGVKESTSLNNIFTGLNLITVLIVIIAGSMKADAKNWNIRKEDIPKNVDKPGEGGFLPFGAAGIMAGAAKCFYGFVGFDAIATTGEEAKNPQRNIPISIVISLIIIFLSYFGISTVLTLMWPYYDQNPDAPFPYVFEQVGWPAIKWIVTIGAIFALCTSLLGCMFPLPRILYAMSNDGLLFKFLSTVHPKTKTPLVATVISGILAGIMSTIFDLQQLINMMSIGTLLAYTIVAICVLILRYQPDSKNDYPNIELKHPLNEEQTWYIMFKKLFNLNMNKYPDVMSSLITKWAACIFSILSIVFCCLIIYTDVFEGNVYYIIAFVVTVIAMIVIITIIGRQPVTHAKITFKVPWVPIVPCASILINLYLMLELDSHTWIRFCFWLLIGFLIYFLYGIRHSAEKVNSQMKKTESKKQNKLNGESSHQNSRF